MATSEPLVPQGLEHGERAKLEEAMAAGGVPKDVSTGGGGVPSLHPSAAAPGGATSAPQSVEGWDVLAGREPTMTEPPAPETPTGVSLFQHRVKTSPNAAMQFYFGRTDEFLE